MPDYTGKDYERDSTFCVTIALHLDSINLDMVKSEKSTAKFTTPRSLSRSVYYCGDIDMKARIFKRVPTRRQFLHQSEECSTKIMMRISRRSYGQGSRQNSCSTYLRHELE